MGLPQQRQRVTIDELRNVGDIKENDNSFKVSEKNKNGDKLKYTTVSKSRLNSHRYRNIVDKGEYNEVLVDIVLDRINRIVYNKDKLGKEFNTKLTRALNELKDNNIEMEVFLWE